ncbi:recombinase family protein [Cuneatibacter sp. NSJ-177]|nr:recombinase family protein [Cuneatibacter sp. NSJ-177]
MGNSFRSIAAALNQEGIPSPRTLYYQQLKKKNIFF